MTTHSYLKLSCFDNPWLTSGEGHYHGLPVELLKVSVNTGIMFGSSPQNAERVQTIVQLWNLVPPPHPEAHGIFKPLFQVGPPLYPEHLGNLRTGEDHCACSSRLQRSVRQKRSLRVSGTCLQCLGRVLGPRAPNMPWPQSSKYANSIFGGRSR